MAALNQDIVIYAGDDAELDISLFEEDGTTPLNVQNATINWALSSIYDTRALLVNKSSVDSNEIELTDAPGGEIKIYLIPTDTDALGGELYKHEVEVSVGGKTTTVLTGIVTINKTLLHAVSS